MNMDTVKQATPNKCNHNNCGVDVSAGLIQRRSSRPFNVDTSIQLMLGDERLRIRQVKTK